MKKMIILKDKIRFIGFPDAKQLYLVIRNSGIEISDKPIKTILPVVVLKLNDGNVESPALSEILLKAGFDEENTLVYNGVDYSLLTC